MCDMPSTLRTAARSALVAAALAAAACTSPEQWGQPRVPVSAASPDGQLLAYVRNHVALDPPDQSIWLRDASGREHELQRLGPDADWCDTIVWSADGGTVGFLVQDARLVVVDAARVRIESEHWLVPEDSYPPRGLVVELGLSADGTRAHFRACERRMTRAGYEHEAGPCSGPRTLDLRLAR
jgi:hypothetical protein